MYDYYNNLSVLKKCNKLELYTTSITALKSKRNTTVSYPRPDECGVLVGRFISAGKGPLLLAATLAPETLCPELFGGVTDCEVEGGGE